MGLSNEMFRDHVLTILLTQLIYFVADYFGRNYSRVIQVAMMVIPYLVILIYLNKKYLVQRVPEDSGQTTSEV